MSDIYIGPDTGNLYKVVALLEEYRPGQEAHDSVRPSLDGALTVVKGVVPRLWTGLMEINVPPEPGYTGIATLFNLWNDHSQLILRDENGTDYTMIWNSEFDISWLSKAANHGVCPFVFVEVLP